MTISASNTLLTISMITREALRTLENNLVFAKGVNREYDSKFAVSGAKIGSTLNIRKPPKYLGRTGAALSIENSTETSVPLTLDTQAGVDIAFTSADLALSIDDFSSRFLEPAISTIANKIDLLGLMQYVNIYNSVGAPGTTPDTLLLYLQAGAKLDFEACPRDNNRSIVMDPMAQVTIVDALKGLIEASGKISSQYETGTMGRAVGFKWSMDQNVYSHTVGPLGGSPAVDVASQTGATLNTKAWTTAAAARLKAGDTFTVAGVYAVNPKNLQSTGQLRQFVCTADKSSLADGTMAIPIAPSIVTSGAYKTVTASPADGALLTITGTANKVGPVNLAYHRDAFALGCADLPLPGGVDMAARVSDKQLGLSIRLIRQYDINTDYWPCRLDLLCGWATLRPELACRIHG